MPDDHAKEYSLLPMAICQECQLRVGYERSFKVQAGRVLANRYLIGIPTSQLTLNRAREIARRLGMPNLDDQSFWGLYSKSNLLLIGFEHSEPGCIYKLYLEFDDESVFVKSAQNVETRLLHRAIKWNAAGASNCRVSDYFWHSELGIEEIGKRVGSTVAGSMIEHPINELVSHTTANIDSDQLRYLEVVEGRRKSFDLNVYATRRNVASIMVFCRRAGAALGAPMESFDRLESIVGRRPLGHLAAGRDLAGNAFFTVYYEPTA